MVEWIKKAPTALLVTICVVLGALMAIILVGYVILSVTGSNNDAFTHIINTISNILGIPLLGTTTVAAVSAARSASKAEEQTNGQLKSNVKAAVHEAINGTESSDGK